MPLKEGRLDFNERKMLHVLIAMLKMSKTIKMDDITNENVAKELVRITKHRQEYHHLL